MRHISIIILSIFFMCMNVVLPSYPIQKGKVEYSIPIDYSKLDEKELNTKGQHYFCNACKLKDGIINEDITNALFIYSVLKHSHPEEINYYINLGILYDKINKDKISQDYFSQAININSINPRTLYHYGNFYYKRGMYKKALKYYNEAYKYGYNKYFDLLYKISDIHEKFGDTRSALKYLKEAKNQNQSKEIDNKLSRLELEDSINEKYYSNTRIRDL